MPPGISETRLISAHLADVKAAGDRTEANFGLERDPPAGVTTEVYLSRNCEECPRYADITDVQLLGMHVQSEFPQDINFTNINYDIRSSRWSTAPDGRRHSGHRRQAASDGSVPGAAGPTLVRLACVGKLWMRLGTSLKRVPMSLVVAAVVGVPNGYFHEALLGLCPEIAGAVPAVPRGVVLKYGEQSWLFPAASVTTRPCQFSPSMPMVVRESKGMTRSD